MSLLGKLTKFGLAKKALDEARKPENQDRIRRMAASVANRAKRKQGGTSTEPVTERRAAPGAETPLESPKPAGTPAEETPATGS